jgi:hypothetical protein
MDLKSTTDDFKLLRTICRKFLSAVSLIGLTSLPHQRKMHTYVLYFLEKVRTFFILFINDK